MPPCPFGKDSVAHALLASSAKKSSLTQSMHMCTHSKARVKAFSHLHLCSTTWPVMSLCCILTQQCLSWQRVCSLSFSLHVCSRNPMSLSRPSILSKSEEGKIRNLPRSVLPKCAVRMCSFVTASSLPFLRLFPPEYCIHSAKQVGEREKHDSSLPNKLSFL